jgi:ABC-type molybdenum transport system ATPase subunit/photorepair protein PhrA
VIIRPGEVESPSTVCRVLTVTRAKDTISAGAECRDAIGYSSLTITIKVQSARQIVYSATGGEALNVTYLKCPI